MGSFESLKSLHREIREQLPEYLSLRIHRSLSWLDCAEQQTSEDAQFIFLWIAFNAAYAREIEDRQDFSERRALLQFIKAILMADKTDTIKQFVWDEFSKSIRLLINNRYVFQRFWDFQAGKITEDGWQSSFESAKQSANRALGNQDIVKVLAIIFDRLYTLRNQLIHGGSTWNSRINRDQIRDGVHFLHQIVTLMIEIMLNHNPNIHGKPCYPVIA